MYRVYQSSQATERTFMGVHYTCTYACVIGNMKERLHGIVRIYCMQMTNAAVLHYRATVLIGPITGLACLSVRTSRRLLAPNSKTKSVEKN